MSSSSECSIFDLIKSLVDLLCKEGNGNFLKVNRKKLHLQAYETLLSHRESNSNPFESFGSSRVELELASCIQKLYAHGDLSDAEKLIKLTKELNSQKDGDPMLRFLLCLANRMPFPFKVLKNPKAHFYVPPQELDGSLYEQLPEHCENINENAQAFFLSFGFDDFPGTNLHQFEKFFNQYGWDTCNKNTVHIQETRLKKVFDYEVFSDVDDVWEEAARLGPLPPHRTWESLGWLQPLTEKPYLTEGSSGKAQHAWEQSWSQKPNIAVTVQQLHRDLGYLLLGYSSTCFPWNKALQKFTILHGLSVAGLTPKVVTELITPLLQCGTIFQRLEEFSASKKQGQGQIVRALCIGVKRLLVLQGKAVEKVVKQSGMVLTELVNAILNLSSPLYTVAALCCRPVPLLGVKVLEELTRQASLTSSLRFSCILYSLLKCSSEEYFRCLGRWLFEGEINEDDEGEFFIQVQPTLLTNRTRKFWSHGFVLMTHRVPEFLRGMEDQIVQCGKVVRLLKLCNPKHPLVHELISEQPSVTCCLQPLELSSLQQQCEKYLERAREACGPVVSVASQFEHNKERQDAFLNMVQKVQEASLKKLRAERQAKIEAEREGKLQILEDLKQQIAEVQAKRAWQKELEREEEKIAQEQMEAMQGEMDKREKEEKEKIIRQHEALSRVADKRRERAEQRIKRLKEELAETIYNKPEANNKLETDNLISPVSKTEEKITEYIEKSPDQALNPPINEIAEDINSNPLIEDIFPSADNKNSSADSNANPVLSPSPRNVPTDLPLNVINHLDNIISARKTKVKILSEEFGIDIQTPQELKTTTDCDKNNFNATNRAAARNKARAFQYGQNRITNKYNEEEAKQNIEVFSEKLVSGAKALNTEPELAHSKTGDSSPSTESMLSPMTPGYSEDISHMVFDKLQDMTPSSAQVTSIMSMSIESGPSMKTETDTPCSGVPPSAMSVSFEGNLSLKTYGSSPHSPSSDSVAFSKGKLNECIITDSYVKKMPSSFSVTSFLSEFSRFSEPTICHKKPDKESLSLSMKKIDNTTSHLGHFLHQSISVVLSVQVRLASQSIIKLFLEDEKLLDHFLSLRRYFLLLDGEFARYITEKLCQGLEENSRSPRGLLNYVTLDTILQRALAASIHGSKDPNASRLSFYARTPRPTAFQISHPAALGCIQLQYRVSWPLCLLITDEALNQYDMVFCFLLGLRRAVWSMDESFHHLQRPANNIDLKILNHSPQCHELRLFRHEIAHLVQAFHGYFMTTAVLGCWQKCEDALKLVSTLDELYSAHASFVKRVKFYCLLRKEAEVIQNLLQATIRSTLKFHGQLKSHSWQRKGNYYEHPAFKRLTDTYVKFKERTKTLLRNLTKMAKRGYQSELFELLHAINMNGHYNLQL